MRLGGTISANQYTDPDSWIAAVRGAGYRAVYCPVGLDADDATIAAYVQAAHKEDLVIAEVGAWSNPISPDDRIREAAMQKCKDSLALADKVGARCCVNIAGSRGETWDGPHEDDLTPATFDLIVETVRKIVDDVKPTRTFYALEPMPWMYPDSPDNYLRLVNAIDRKNVAVHLDAVNLICSPQRYFGQTAFIKECFEKLGSMIKSCHVKDIILRHNLTVHLDEVRPGLGMFDLPTFLHLAHQLDPDMPVMLEHLPTQEDYALAAAHVRAVAQKENLPL